MTLRFQFVDASYIFFLKIVLETVIIVSRDSFTLTRGVCVL